MFVIIKYEVMIMKNTLEARLKSNLNVVSVLFETNESKQTSEARIEIIKNAFDLCYAH